MYRAQAGEMETEKEKLGVRGVGRYPGRRSGTNLHILYNADVVAASGSQSGVLGSQTSWKTGMGLLQLFVLFSKKRTNGKCPFPRDKADWMT